MSVSSALKHSSSKKSSFVLAYTSLLALMFFISGCSREAESLRLEIDDGRWNFGEVKSGEELSRQFFIRNAGGKGGNLVFEPSCLCQLDDAMVFLEPGSVYPLTVTVSTTGPTGSIKESVKITSPESKLVWVLEIQGRIWDDIYIRPDAPSLYLTGDPQADQLELQVTAEEKTPLRLKNFQFNPPLLKVIETNNNLDHPQTFVVGAEYAEMQTASFPVKVTMSVEVETSESQTYKRDHVITVDTMFDPVPTPAEIVIGKGDQTTFPVILKSETGLPFKVTRVGASRDLPLSAKFEYNQNTTEHTIQIDLSLALEKSEGQPFTIRIYHTANPATPLRIPVRL